MDNAEAMESEHPAIVTARFLVATLSDRSMACHVLCDRPVIYHGAAVFHKRYPRLPYFLTLDIKLLLSPIFVNPKSTIAFWVTRARESEGGAVLLVEGYGPIVEEISRGNRRRAIIKFRKCPFQIGVDEGRLVDAADGGRLFMLPA
jgi:hypothetical protein